MVAVPPPPAPPSTAPAVPIDQPAPAPNLKDTVAFLKALPPTPAGRETIFVMPLDGAPQGVYISPDDAEDFLRTYQGTHNCYWQPNISSTPNRKSKKEDITYARMLHVDLDDPTEQALTTLQSFTPPPSTIIFSGGGYQAFWFFSQLIPTSNPPARDMIEDRNNRIRHVLGADHCYNIERIMRLPGTLNVPDAKKVKSGRTTALAYIVEFFADDAHRYTINSFDHLPPAPSSVTSSPTNSPSTHPQPPPAAFQLTLDALSPTERAAIPEEIQQLIVYGDTQANYPSRSEAIYRISCELARANITEAKVAALLVHPAHAISASIRTRSDPFKEALRQAHRGRDAASTGWPKATKHGPVYYNYPNCQVALSRLRIEGAYDVFTDTLYVWGPNQPRTKVTESIIGSIADQIIAAFRFDPGIENTNRGLNSICYANEEHPLLDYFNELTWDGTSRIQHLFPYYFGAEDTPFNREISLIFMVAAIRLIKHPGTKFDVIPVLEGPQGTGKTTSLSILAGKGYVNSSSLLDMDARAQSEAMSGTWIYELSELDGMHKADIGKIKAFASRDVDKVRPAYGRRRVDRPRQTVFVGTTNEDDYLRDSSGNRRFWPVKTTTIRLKELREDRDQLWAEAIVLEAQNRSIVLDESLWPIAAEMQKSRLMPDSWDDELRTLGAYVQNGKVRVSSQDAITFVKGPAEKQLQSDFIRVRDCMRKLGWIGPKPILINGKLVRGYEAPDDGSVPYTLIPDDPAPGEPGRPSHPTPSHLRVVDENFTVHGQPATNPKPEDK
jgi:Virulence-associated protein E